VYPKFLSGDYKGAMDYCSKALVFATYETDKKEILELRSNTLI